MATEFQEIPVLDLADLDNRKYEVAKDLYTYSKDIGFFYIKNTGLEDILPTVFEAAHQFFALPLQEKQALAMANSTEFRGYLGLEGMSADPGTRGDLHEGFNIGSEDTLTLGDTSSKTVAGDKTKGNQWPASLGEDFKRKVMNYFEAVETLSKRMFPLFALALGLPENWFDDKIGTSGSRMRLIHYPPQYGEVDDRQVGIGAHTDYEIFTVLAQQVGVPALQVKNKAGKWIGAPPIPGTWVVNLGDMLARMSNDLFVSTVHRAVNRTGVERFSCPVFVGPAYDTIIDTIPSCITADRPKKYDAIKAGDFVKMRVGSGVPDLQKKP